MIKTGKVVETTNEGVTVFVPFSTHDYMKEYKPDVLVEFEEGKAFAAQILKEHPDVDGIFCITDLVAVGVLAYFNEQKIPVPQQVKVIGFSN